MILSHQSDMIIAAFTALKEEHARSKILMETVVAQNQQIAEMKPKATYYDVVLKCRNAVNAYAIQNMHTGMDIRVFNAGIPNEAKIIQYPHHQWECMTWQFIKMKDGSFLLKNLYTYKTFQPSSKIEAGVALWQQPIEANQLQYWEFIKGDTDYYHIRLKGTELYITPSSQEKNANIVLLPLKNTADQQWKLLEQHPIV